MLREDYLKEIEKQGYIQIKEDIFIKNNNIYRLDEYCHCIIDGIRQCTYELKFTGKHKCCLYCDNSYLKGLELDELDDEKVIICGLINEYIGYPDDDAIKHCCENWIY